MRKFGLLVVCLAGSALGLFAQANANKGEIVGTVTDPSGAVVQHAAVKALNTETGFSREVTANEDGQYRLVLLNAGTYDVSASASSFAPHKFEGIVLSVGSSVGLNITLQVERTTTTIEVAASLIQTAQPSPMTGISEQAIRNLPINGRRFHDFAVSTPTAQVERSRGQLSFAGQRGINSNVMLDGADYNQPFFGGIRGGERSNSIFTVPQSAIEEFQVVTTGYSAEYGRSTGGILNAVTKAGTNSYHGSGFYQIRHRDAGAEDPVFRVQSAETLHQFGGSAGGPIMKDRLFWFAAVERQLSTTPRRVLFDQLVNATPTDNTAEAFNFLKSQELPFDQTNDGLAFTTRADYQMDAGHRLTMRYNFSDNKAENAVSVGNAITPFTTRTLTNDGIEKDRTHTGTAQYTHVFSPSVLNDLRFTGTYEVRPREAKSELPQVSTTIGTFGARDFLPTTQNDMRWQISDALSMTTGAHTVKLGADYSRITAAQLFGFSQFGSFTFSGSNVNEHLDILSRGGAIPNRFGHSSVSYSRQIGNLLADFPMHQIAFFAQDSWRVSSQLTLEFGLRWEGQLNPEPTASNSALVNLVKGYVSPLGSTVDPTRIPDSTKQWMPRFGFAWSPLRGSRRIVVRGHTGIFYATTPLLLFADATNNFRTPPGNVSISLFNTGNKTVYDQLKAVGVDLNASTLDALPVIPVEKVIEASALATGSQPNPFVGANATAMAPDFVNPRSVQAGFGLDAEVTRNFVAGVQLNYVNTVHLERNRDHNMPVPSIRATDASLRPFYGLRSTGRRPIPSLGSITLRESSSRSMFRGATISAQYRTRRMQLGTFYTLSESFSDDDNERSSGGFLADDHFNLIPDYNYSDLDSRHQLSGYFVAPLVAGFEVSGLFGVRSAWPVDAKTGADTNEDRASADRPYSAPGVPFERNQFRNRTVVTSNNLRILKTFGIGEFGRLQFSAEFFNLFNLDNVIYSGNNASVYGLGIGTNGSPVAIDPRFQRLRLATGEYDPANRQNGGPFQAQFGVRFLF